MSNNDNDNKTREKTSIEIIPKKDVQKSVNMLKEMSEKELLPRIMEKLTMMPSAQRAPMRKYIEEDVSDMAMANLLLMSLTSKSEKIRYEATNSILDRLGKPKMTAQFRKEQKTTLNHEDLMKFLKKKDS